MIKKVNKTIEINFTTDVLTRECAGQVFIAIYELLLFQRNTIPFVYQTFKYQISRLPEIDEDDENVNFETQRQISVARRTLQEIENHFEVSVFDLLVLESHAPLPADSQHIHDERSP